MLVYHPLFDPYHSMLRMVYILNVSTESMEVDRLRILDFYLTLPHLLSEIRFPVGHSKTKKYFLSLHTAYNNVQDPRRLFREVRGIQTASLHSLVAREFINKDAFLSGNALLKKTSAIENITNIAITSDSLNETARTFIKNVLSQIPLTGPGGLKDRTGLLEHKYDAA